MSVVFTRDKEGVVKTPEGTFKVPKNRSALSMFDQMIMDGDEFNEDGWVYKNGEKYRKWFVTLQGTNYWDKPAKVWEPRLFDQNQIKILEKKRYKIAIWMQKQNAIYGDIIREVWERGKFSGLRKSTSGKEGWVVFRDYREEDRPVISWNWEEKPSAIIDQELCNLYCSMEKRIRECGRRLEVANLGFFNLINNIYSKNSKTVLDLEINYRRYLFQKLSVDWTCISVPEDDNLFVEWW